MGKYVGGRGYSSVGCIVLVFASSALEKPWPKSFRKANLRTVIWVVPKKECGCLHVRSTSKLGLLDRGPIGDLETSAANHQSTLHNITEERRSHLSIYLNVLITCP